MKLNVKNLRCGNYIYVPYQNRYELGLVSVENRVNYQVLVGDRNEVKLMTKQDAEKNLCGIPLRKDILELLGFEAKYNDYTYELYFEKTYPEYIIQVLVMDRVLRIYDKPNLYKIIDIKCETLHELQNYVNIDLGIKDHIKEISDYGKEFFKYEPSNFELELRSNHNKKDEV